MTTTAFTSFLPEVLPLANGCSDLLAVNAVRNSAIEFCSGTMYWQETQDPVTLAAADLPYTLEAPAGARVIQPLSVLVDGLPLEAKSLDWLDNRLINWRSMRAPRPAYYYQPDPNNLVLVPAPDHPVEVIFRLAYCPTRDATGIEEWVYQNQLEVIASGALARLLAMPAQPWSNPDLAKYHRGLFNQGMTDATIEANKSFTRGSLRVQFRKVS